MNIVFQQVKVNMENLQKEIGCSLLIRSQSHYCNDIFFASEIDVATYLL